MFSDTTTLTVATVARTLTRIAFGDQKGIFQDATNGLKLTISHLLTKGNRKRLSVRLDHAKTAADPFIAGMSKPVSGSVLLTADYPALGYTTAEMEDHLEAFADWLKVQANRDKLVNGES